VTEHLSKRGRQILAAALLVLAVTLFWAGLVWPLLGYLEAAADKRRVELASLSRDRAVLSQDANVQRALRTVKDSPRWNRLYVFDRPDQAVLQFETDLRDLIKATANPSSMTAVATSTQGSLSRMAVKVALSMPIDQWTEVLNRVKSSSKLMQLRNVTMQASDYQPVGSNPVISIQAEFVAYFFKTPNSHS
jgi:hypothetical protein